MSILATTQITSVCLIGICSIIQSICTNNKLNKDPKAMPQLNDAAIIAEDISFSSRLTFLKNSIIDRVCNYYYSVCK